MAVKARTRSIVGQALADPAAAADLCDRVDGAAQGLSADPLDLASLSATGLIARTGTGTSAVRTLTGTANQIAVANGDGASANPTISLPATINVATSYSVGGTKVVGAQAALVATVTATASTGSLPTPNGTVTIADAATPTVVELLEYCTELKAKFDAVLAAVKAHGLIASS